MRTKKITFLLALLCLLSGYALGQGITGVIMDTETNDPIPGANILVVGTTNIGTVSDVEGKFSLNLPESANQIQISSIGYTDQVIDVLPGGSYSILMVAEDVYLNEIVVVGYGTQKKANLTGSVATVDVEKALESRTVTDVGRALQGTIPGLSITTTSGAIGGLPTINIRGSLSTIGGKNGSPIVLVDNVEVPNLNYVNPDDIESISVLKDASTTAIYGPRAAFGAILITTKKGNKDGKVKVSYSNNYSWATPTKMPEHTRADLNLQYSWDQINALRTTPLPETGYIGFWYNPETIARVKDWIDTYGDGEDLGREMVEGRDFDYRAGGGAFFYRPWDIRDIYFKKWTPQQTQNVTISGGSEKTQYNLSAGYMNQNGVLKQFDDFYRRLNLAGFISTEVNKWLTVRGGFTYGKTQQETPFLYAGAAYDPQYYMYRWHQTYPYGTFNGNEFRGGVNDLKVARPVEDDVYYSRFSAGTTLKLLKGLTAEVDYTYSQTVATNHTVGGYANGIDFWYRSGTQTFDDIVKNYSSTAYDYAKYTADKKIRNTFNAYLTYEKALGNHKVKVMGGSNMEDEEYTYLLSQRAGVYDFEKGEVNLAKGDQTTDSKHNWWSTAGFFSRINYSFSDKYLLEVNGRYDGTSKFAKNHRWNFFPSVSAGWRVTEEPFMQSVKSVLSNWKLRASFGENGNQEVDLNAYTPTMNVSNPTSSGNYWLINNNYAPFIRATTLTGTTLVPKLVDPALTWETVRTLDFGSDARFFNDRLGLTVDWYQRKNLDVLSVGETLPSSVGALAPQTNFGELTTNGIEIALDYNHTFSNDLHITINAQFNDYRTKISKYPSESAGLIKADNTEYEGKYIGDIWGYKVDRLYQNEDFVLENGVIVQTVQPNGQSKNTLVEGIPNQYILESGLFKFGPGDVKFKDLNNDGVIDYGTNTVGNSGDRTVIGNTTPRYQYSFRLSADWKGFDIDIFFQGVGKRQLWATGNMVLPGYYGAEANFAHTLDYWTPENTDAFYPRAMEYSQTAQWNYEKNDRYLLNAAYLRMKSLVVGYSLPQKWISKVNIDRFRIYFEGGNLFEFDKMGDIPIDPEIDWTINTSADSRSFGRSYPYRRTLSFGIQLEF